MTSGLALPLPTLLHLCTPRLTMSVSTWGDLTKTETTWKKSKNKVCFGLSGKETSPIPDGVLQKQK